MSNYEKVVKAATKPKPGPIKPKYIDPIIATTFSTDASLQYVCRTLAERLRDPSSNVVFKSLIILHTMARNGEVDNVLGQMNAQSSSLRLRDVAAKGSFDGPGSLNTYAQYLDERVRAYRELKHDVIRSSDASRTGASNSNRLRRLTVEKGLLREVSITQKVANALLQCSFFLDDLRDDLTMSAFRMALKDLLALFTAINEGVINILEHYFEMAKSDAERALELYKRFCRQTEKVVAYLASAKKAAYSLNMAIPNLKHAPVSLAGALEEYLKDPNFEQNRQEYKENKRIADGGAPKPKPKEAAKQKEPEKEKVKPPTNNQAVQDFFESIDTNQVNMFSNVPAEQAFFGMQPQMTGMQPQMTGYNPFMMGGMGGQSFMMPQQTGFLQPQATGFNPFRQTMASQPTGNFGPFGGQALQAPFQQQPAPFQPQQTGAFQSPPQPSQPAPQSPFQQPKSPFQSPSTASPSRSTPLLAQKTGSRNPFAPPPGSTPPPPPMPTKTGPSLNELASGAAVPSGGGAYALGANAWVPPQKTGMADVASEFARPQQQQETPKVQPQQTGFGGVRKFEPTSSFGASLAKEMGAQPTGMGNANGNNPFGQGGAFGSTFSSSGVSSQPTGFAAPSQNGQPGNATSAFNSAFSSGVSSQPTGFASGGTSSQNGQAGNANSAFNSAFSGMSSQPTGFAAGGSSQGGTSNGLSAFNSAFSSTNMPAPSQNGASNGASLQPQATGFGGIKPFQPTSSFGQQMQDPNLVQF